MMTKPIKTYFEYHTSFARSDKREEYQKLCNIIQSMRLPHASTLKYSRGIRVDQYHIELSDYIPESKLRILRSKIEIAAKSDNVNVYVSGGELIIETPNMVDDAALWIGDMVSDDFYNMPGLPIMMGRSVDGQDIFMDLSKQPHMLVAGTTGSGKSMFLHSVIASLLLKQPDIEIYAVDTKRVEFERYNRIPTFHSVSNVDDAIFMLRDLCDEMESRYTDFACRGYRDITAAMNAGENIRPIVVVIDEFADLIQQGKREVERYVVRLAQKARAAGIHIVIATQSPRKDVLTGLIKTNIPCRVGLKVSSGLESRIILDRMGSEKLIGHGDMLLIKNGDYEPTRIQGILLRDEDMQTVINITTSQTGVARPQNQNISTEQMMANIFAAVCGR